MSEQTEQSLRAIEKKVDALGGKFDMLAQKLDMYDVGALKQNQEVLQRDVTDLKARVSVGAFVAGAVLVGVLGVLFKVFMQ